MRRREENQTHVEDSSEDTFSKTVFIFFLSHNYTFLKDPPRNNIGIFLDCTQPFSQASSLI